MFWNYYVIVRWYLMMCWRYSFILQRLITLQTGSAGCSVFTWALFQSCHICVCCKVPSSRNSMQFPWFLGVVFWPEFCIFCRSWNRSYLTMCSPWEIRVQKVLRTTLVVTEFGSLAKPTSASSCWRSPAWAATVSFHLELLLLLPAMSPSYCCRPSLWLTFARHHANLLLLVRSLFSSMYYC
jgi:hypothetical protein